MIQIARQLNGVVTVEALREAGLPNHVVRLGVSSGWVRTWQGVYVPSAGEVTFDQWVATGKLVFGDEAAFGGAAALYKMGFLTREPRQILFWTKKTKQYRKIDPGCRLVPKRDFGERLQRISPGYGHTGLVDSLTDYMNNETQATDVVGAIIQVRKQLPNVSSRLVEALAGVKRLRHRRLAEQVLLAYPAFDSPLEWLFLEQVIRAHGVEEPERQWRCPEGFLRDNAWPWLKAIVELDGDAFHTDSRTVGRDRQKDRLMAKHGFVTLRYGYRDVADRACGVAKELGEVIPALAVQRCKAELCEVSSRGLNRAASEGQRDEYGTGVGGSRWTYPLWERAA